MDCLVVKINLCHIIHVVSQLWLNEVVGNHGVEHLAAHLDAVVAQHLDVVFHILSDFQNIFVFVQRFENIYNLLCFVSIGRYWNVKSLSFLECKA